MFFRKKKKEEKKPKEEIQSEVFIHLSSKTVFTGNLQTERSIRIDCHFKGDIITTERIVLSSEAKVEGNIKCKYALITGQVKGNIVALETMILKAPAHIKGNILTKNIHIEAGVVIDGIYKIIEEPKDKPA